MVTRPDYESLAVEAARSVLLELTRLLGEYRDHIVLVGGWVPELLLPHAEPRHVGSLDIDLALDHRSLPEAGYESIRKLLLGRGYEPHDLQPFIFYRRLSIQGREMIVEVDLLAGEYEGTSKRHRTQRVQDVRPRKARGADLALELSEELNLEGRLPNGAVDRAKVRVAGIVPFLVMKGMALHDRLKEKDAYDVYFCLRNFPGGIEALAAEFRPHVGHGLVKEGLRKLAEKFASPEAFGPAAVADFEQVADRDQRQLIQRDAYERVAALTKELSVGV